MHSVVHWWLAVTVGKWDNNKATLHVLNLVLLWYNMQLKVFFFFFSFSLVGKPNQTKKTQFLGRTALIFAAAGSSMAKKQRLFCVTSCHSTLWERTVFWGEGVSSSQEILAEGPVEQLWQRELSSIVSCGSGFLSPLYNYRTLLKNIWKKNGVAVPERREVLQCAWTLATV